MGITGSGKTGALASLAAAGYQVRILDTDNQADVLKNILTHPKSKYPKEAVANVSYIPLTEIFTQAGGKLIPTSARVWSQLAGLLDNWQDGSTNLGKVTTWGPKDVLVFDTLTSVSTAAFNHIQAMNSRLGQGGSGFNGQRDIGGAQDLIKSLLEAIKSTSFKCNVIVNSHIVFTNENGGKPTIKKDDKGNVTEEDERFGFPKAIGRALSPSIGEYFNTMLELRMTGQGPGAKARLFTKSQGVTLCKNTSPFAVEDSYPLESGLADYFKAVRGE